MMIIELPEGGWVDAESIVAVVPMPPENEFATEGEGSAILLSSGHSVQTEETPERVMQQIAECLVAAQELGNEE